MKAGFTLIELSIVLVIIGLIVGGVLVGRDLINSAAIRSQIAQLEKYNQAVNAFRTKYNCLPGDCSKAAEYLPAVVAQLGGWGSGNGNDSGFLEDDAGNVQYAYNTGSESKYFWMDLFYAGLADCCGGSNYTNLMGTDFPLTRIGNAAIAAVTLQNSNGYFLGINKVTNNTTSVSYGFLVDGTVGIFTPKQMQAFDRKIDDGKALTGNVYVAMLYGGDNSLRPQDIWYAGLNCLTNTTPADYNLTYGGAACIQFVKMQGM